MSRARFLLWRLGWTVLATYLVLSATFALVAFTPDPNAAVVAWGEATGEDSTGEDVEAAVDAYRAARNLDEPFHERYLAFLVRVSTLQLGESTSQRAPVRSVLADHALVSLMYVLPAVVVSVLVGGGLGLYAAMHESSLLDTISTGTAYLLLGLPNFWLAVVVRGLAISRYDLFITYDLARGYLDAENLLYLTLPTVVLTSTLLAAQLRYVRSETRNYLREAFVKTARSKGADRRRVARHALRNAVLPLVSLFFGELLAVLFVAVFVIEAVLAVPGLGAVGLAAIRARDVSLVIGVTLVPFVVGVLGNFIQDVLTSLLDPRTGRN